MKKQSFLIGAIILAAGGVFAKIVGAFYKIPLTNILGTNGMGLYYLVFPLYSLVLVLISSGTSLAVVRFISIEKKAHNQYNQKLIFKVALIYVFVLSLIFSGLFVLLRYPLSLLQGNVNASFSYVAIAPAIVFASVIAVIRGYFQGQQNMMPTLYNNLAEQIIKLICGLVLANLFLKRGVTYAVFGAVLGVTISEFFALIFLTIHYFIFKKRYIYKIDVPKTKNLTFVEALKKIVYYAYPATLGALVTPITSFLDSFMIINILTNAGFSSLQATNLYGISNGIVNTLISLPVVICSAIATAIVPNLSGLFAKNNESEVSFKSSFFIKITWLIAIPCFLMFLIFSPDIITMLYKNGLSDLVINEYVFAYKLLMISSVSILYYAFLQTFTSILQSINKPLIPFIGLSVALIIRIGLLYLFVSNPNINIFGVALSNIGFLSVAILINLVAIKKYIKLNYNFYKLIIAPISAGIITGIVLYFLRLALMNVLNVWIYAIICGLVCITCFVGLIVLFKCFSKQEVNMLKRKNKLKV